MTRLMIIHGSTRHSRRGDLLTRELERLARDEHGFDVDFVDLQELDFPFLDETEMPRTGKYELPHTIAWAKRVASADAVIWASPEYNGGYSAPLKNAIDHLFAEWLDKPIGVLTWGAGPLGGQEAGDMLCSIARHMGLNLVGELVTYPKYLAAANEEPFGVTDEWTRRASALLASIRDTARDARPAHTEARPA